MIKSIRYIIVFKYYNGEYIMKKIIFYNNKNIIYARLKEARKKKQLSQSELAAKLQTYNINVDQQIISRIEKNERMVTDYEIACICKCLEISYEWLLQDFENLL